MTKTILTGHALIPLLGLLGLVAWVLRKRRRRAGWSRASGVVIALWSPGRGSRVPAPVVQFHSADGKEFTHRSNSGSNVPGFKVGEAVVVVYDPTDPSRAVISSFIPLWFGECMAALALAFALVFTVLFDLGIIR